MKRLLFLALVGVAVWQAWVHYPQVFSHKPHHQVLIENLGPVPLERLRVTLGSETMVRETLAPSQVATFRFPVGDETSFLLVWQRSGTTGDIQWRGGSAGPNEERHILGIAEDNQVTYRKEATIRSIR